MSGDASKASQPAAAKASGSDSASSSTGPTISLKPNAPEFVPVPAAAAPAKQGGQQKQKKNGPSLNPNSAKAKAPNPPSGAAKLATTVNAAPFVPSAPSGKPGAANPKMSAAAASFVPKTGPPAPAAVPPPPRSQDHKPHDGGYNSGGHQHHHQGGGGYHHRPNHPGGRKPYPQQAGPYRPDGPTPGRGRGRGRDGGRGGGRGGGYGMGGQQGPGGFQLLGPGRAQLSSRFASEQLRQQLQQRSYLAVSQWVPQEGDELGIPEKIQNYHSIYPLENTPAAAPLPSGVLGVPTACYKGVSSQDGVAYCLRHIDGRVVVPSSDLVAAARGACEAWGRLREHPNLVALRGTFLNDEIGGAQSLFFVHDYHPGAVTLAQAHMQATATATGLVRNAATEEQLWSYLVQLCQATSAVHGCGLSFRPGGLAPSKVLLTGFGRIRVGAGGVLDVLQGAGQKEREAEVGLLQVQDLVGIGQLILLLACSSTPAGPSMDYLHAHFSPELNHTVSVLLGAGEGRGSITSCGELRVMLGERAFGELYSQQAYVDSMVTELGKEVENGRLLRLLIKLGFISERPDGSMDGSWSETGDRYLLKLFQDWTFHQVSEDGAPLLDWGHVLESLNKVDAGVPEKILLLGRDEQSLLVASYADLKRCLDTSFAELKAAAAAGRHAANPRRPPDYPHDHGHHHHHHH